MFFDSLVQHEHTNIKSFRRLVGNMYYYVWEYDEEDVRNYGSEENRIKNYVKGTYLLCACAKKRNFINNEYAGLCYFNV